MSSAAPPMMTTFERLAREVTQYACEAAGIADKPDSDDVSAMLETVFFASLAREEGRPVRLRVGFVAAEGPARPTGQTWGWWALPFESELPFEKNELVKLAPSVDSRQSFIAVTKRDAGLRIWGLINLGASTINLHEGKTSRSTTIGPEFVEIEALTPGVLDVKIGPRWTRRLADGQIDDLPVHPFRPDGPLADIVEHGRDEGRMTPGLWARTLRLTLREIQAARHGGTLLLHAGSEQTWSDHNLRMKYRVQGQGVVLSDACQRASSREDTFDDDQARMMMGPAMPGASPPLTAGDAHRLVQQSSSDVHGEWLDAVRWVASLAAIDGALLLSWTFGVWAFGVIIESVQPIEISHAFGSDERDWKLFPWNQFGTRHQSAAAYCRAHPTSAAIVVSQDGVVSLFRCREGRVVMWRPCEILDFGG